MDINRVWVDLRSICTRQVLEPSITDAAGRRRGVSLLDHRLATSESQCGGTISVNLRNFKIHACNFSYSSGINNPPRADVWQPVVFVEPLVSARHLRFQRM